MLCSLQNQCYLRPEKPKWEAVQSPMWMCTCCAPIAVQSFSILWGPPYVVMFVAPTPCGSGCVAIFITHCFWDPIWQGFLPTLGTRIRQGLCSYLHCIDAALLQPP